MPPNQLFEFFVEAQEKDPDLVARLLENQRKAVDQDLETVGPEVLMEVWALRASLPLKLWRRHFGDLPPPQSPPGVSRRVLTGRAIIREDHDRTKLRVHLHCNPVRLPNQMKVEWRGDDKTRHRFWLDLITAVGCDREPEPMRIHRGEGLGRLDELRGATAEWTFEDMGKRRDHVRLVVKDPSGQIVLDLDTTIDHGFLRGLEDDHHGDDDSDDSDDHRSDDDRSDDDKSDGDRSMEN
jgi:hypothetical protein